MPLRGCRAISREPLDDERHDQQDALDARQRREEADRSGQPPAALAHVVERGDRQHEEQRLGIDRREEDRRREDRNVEDRAPRDRAVVFVLEQFVEKEQAEEERRRWRSAVRRSDGCRPALPRCGSAADRAGRRPCRFPGSPCVAMSMIVNGVPAAPHREQRVPRFLDVQCRRAGR